jgi:hypothetical protein
MPPGIVGTLSQLPFLQAGFSKKGLLQIIFSGLAISSALKKL